MFDSHIHSSFSADSKASLDEIAESAILKKMKVITITDHIDYEHVSGHVFEFIPEAYDEKITKIQEKYKDRLDIRKGVELGVQPQVILRCKELMKTHTFDFVMASLHCCHGEDFFFGNYFEGKTPFEAMHVYLSLMRDMILQYDDFDVLGHIDLPKRYNADVAKLDPRKLEPLYKDIFKILIDRGQGIEVNTSGLRQDVNEQFPSHEVLKMYYEAGGRLLTLGSDAHDAQSLGAGFEDVRTLLLELGFTSVYTYKSRRQEAHSLLNWA